MGPAPHLKVVEEPPSEAPGAEGAPDLGDLALVTLLFLLNVLPVAGALTGIGTWSPSVVGFAAVAALLAGRELWSQLRAHTRKR